jgi:uncharacterized phage protein (TIGR02220 family)
MELLLFIKDLRKKGSLYYETWMPLLIQYNGENGQAIKLSVNPNVAKSTYYRIIQYGIDVFPKYIKTHSLIKKRNEVIIIVNLQNEVIVAPKEEVIIAPKEEVIIKEVKITRQPKVKPKNNEELIFKIVDFLNECTGKSFKPNSKVAIKNINDRLKEGYTLDDFIKVISVKATKWLGTKWEDYLTPSTLFGNKFDSYLNEKINTEKTKQENAYEQVIKATELGFDS